MKKFDTVKTFELFIFVGFAAICFYRIVIASDIYQQMTGDPDLRALCLLLWAAMFMCFFMIFVDFSMFSKQNQNLTMLSEAANTDTIAQIGNRFSVDSIIDEYAEKEIPKEMGCAMIELSSLKDVNAANGRMAGNEHIRNFSIILKMSALDECIVGRNGGNRFVVLYEKSADLHLEVFLDRLAEKVRDHNANGRNHKISYNYGTAYAGIDDITSITRLIALSSMRLNENSAHAELEEAVRLAGGIKESYEYTAYGEDVPTEYDFDYDINASTDIPDDEDYHSPALSRDDIALISLDKTRMKDIKRTRSMLFRRRLKL